MKSMKKKMKEQGLSVPNIKICSKATGIMQYDTDTGTG